MSEYEINIIKSTTSALDWMFMSFQNLYVET